MQNNPSREVNLEFNQTERPLQKSMVQLTTQYSPRSSQNRPHAIDISSLASLKKSQIISKQNVSSASTITNNSQTNFNFNVVNQGYQPIFNRDNKKISYLQAGTTSASLKGLLSPIKTEIRYQTNPQDSTKYASKVEKMHFSMADSKSPVLQQQQIILEIATQVKEKHLPQLLGKLRKEVYDDIYNLRLEFQAFREETRNAIKKTESSLLEMKFLQTTHQTQVSKIGVHETKSLGSNSYDDFGQLQMNFFLLEGRLNKIETRIAEHFKLNCDQFDNLKAKLSEYDQKHAINIGPIKSSLPSILIEYRQNFIVKKEGAMHQIMINSATYYIDKSGYLLDQDNHYLIDRRGYQIKLEEKHFKLLESHHLIAY